MRAETLCAIAAGPTIFTRIAYCRVGLLGEGRCPFKAEKRVRNPYAAPYSACVSTQWGIGLLGEGRRVLSAEKRVQNPYALPFPACRETLPAFVSKLE